MDIGCKLIPLSTTQYAKSVQSINLTILPGPPKAILVKGKSTDEQETTEYSSREVKPSILLLGDLLRAHATFLLHHASSLSALFVRTKRPKFIGILARYWDTYLSTWNVLMHGNPTNSLYGGIKVAACGELGMGVGEEERGSGEREVLEGFVGRIEGLVDVVVSKFGDSELSNEKSSESGPRRLKPTEPWLGSGNEPAAEDGAVFLGTGALSRKSLRDVSHWIEDLYRWGSHAYGVVDNPTSNRRTKKSKARAKAKPIERTLSPEAKHNSRRVYGLTLRDKSSVQSEPPLNDVPPTPAQNSDLSSNNRLPKLHRPTFQRNSASFGSTGSESGKGSVFMNYLKLGYGTHWSLGGSSAKEGTPAVTETTPTESSIGSPPNTRLDGAAEPVMHPQNDSVGHYLIGLLGDIENDVDGEGDDAAPEAPSTEGLPNEYRYTSGGENARVLIRTLTVELEREEDARAETEISIDLGNDDMDRASSKHGGSEHTASTINSFESQDRNKTKKLRVVVYVKKPFIFVLLFDLRAPLLAMTNLYRSLHYQMGPLIKPLLNSTSFRASKPDLSSMGSGDTSAPIFDLLWNPKLLTINSTIPNIPDPHQMYDGNQEPPPWSRIEALNTHMQIINTYISVNSEKAELERTCKTSRGWWVVWTKLPDLEPPPTSLNSGKVQIPGVITEDPTKPQNSPSPMRGASGSHGTSTLAPTSLSMQSGPAHPFQDSVTNLHEYRHLEKEVFLIRRAGDHAAVPARAFSGRSVSAPEAASAGNLSYGIGVDTKRYIESLLNLNR